MQVFGRPTLKPEEQPKAEFKGITPDWLRALGGRVLRGRDFTEADALEAPGVVLINETLARRYFPNEDPIGQRFKMGSTQPPLGATNVWGLPQWSTIVGVVSDIKSLHPQPEAVPEAYMPYWQWPMQNPTILIRTMDELLSETVAQPRLQTGLLSLFAGVALLLAAVGLPGCGLLIVRRVSAVFLSLPAIAAPGAFRFFFESGGCQSPGLDRS